MKGERAVARERSRITQLLADYDFILVTGGLGCGTATGGIRTLASVAKGLAIPAVFLLTTPFSFEYYTKRKNAEDCIGELLPITEALVTLPNDLLFSTLIICIPMPYLKLDNKLLSPVVYNQIHSFPVSCLRFHITVSSSVNDWF